MKKLFIVVFGLVFALPAMGAESCDLCRASNPQTSVVACRLYTNDDGTQKTECDFKCDADYFPNGRPSNGSQFTKIANGATTIDGSCKPAQGCQYESGRWVDIGYSEPKIKDSHDECGGQGGKQCQCRCIGHQKWNNTAPGNKCPVILGTCYDGFYPVYKNKNYWGWCYNSKNCTKDGKQLKTFVVGGVTYTDTTCISSAASTETDATPDAATGTPQEDNNQDNIDRNNTTDGSENQDNANIDSDNNNANDANDTEATKKAIQESVSALDQIFTGVKANKWRTDDGKFNTARLASDMTAGVVLGTAGALITSSVVKKNQVESGFEDIQCTISGQNVAGFGDEFTVGVK